MANQSFYNSYDARRDSGRNTQNILRQAGLLAYDGLKFFLNFCGSMINMVMGK